MVLLFVVFACLAVSQTEAGYRRHYGGYGHGGGGGGGGGHGHGYGHRGGYGHGHGGGGGGGGGGHGHGHGHRGYGEDLGYIYLLAIHGWVIIGGIMSPCTTTMLQFVVFLSPPK